MSSSSSVRGGKEHITPEDIDALIEFNRQLMIRRGGHHFGADRALIEDILIKGLDQFRGIADRHTRVVNMAAWILYKISKGDDGGRPFFDGNKTSASTMAIKFLNWNGYDLPIELLQLKMEMHELLTEVQRSRTGFGDVRAFVKRSAVTF